MAAKGTEIRGDRKTQVIGSLAGWLMRLYCATLRFEIVDRCGLAVRGAAAPGPVIYSLWHESIFVVPAAWRRATRGARRAAVLTSASHDGGMLAQAMAVFGIDAVRGSSSRRALAALVGLRKVLKEGRDICITPDGPRGPRHQLQGGLVKLAETSGARVLPIHVEFAAAWQLKTWDRFRIPKPCSRVRVIFDETLAVPPDLTEDDFEAWRARIEELLRRGDAAPDPTQS